ncbi:hypothetical protein N9L68_00845 [bacterium]|nr:hypothetical protein [bacterium]
MVQYHHSLLVGQPAAGIVGRITMSEPASALSPFRRVNAVEAFLLVKTKPATWSTEVILLRFLNKGTGGFMVQASGKALRAVQTLEELLAYVFSIPGKAVKKSSTAKRNGVGGPYEVRITEPVIVRLAPVSWPRRVPYEPLVFSDLSQRENGDWVDVVGWVADVGPTLSEGQLAKREIMLSNGERVVTLELLGDKGRQSIIKWDLVAVKGAKVSEWIGKRQLTTGYLTVVEVNPNDNPAITPPELGEGSRPLKRAMAMRADRRIAVQEVHRLIGQMRQDAEKEGEVVQPLSFSVVAKMHRFAEKVFDGDMPVLGDDANLRLRVKASLWDEAHALEGVTFWQGALRDIWQTGADTVVGMWEACAEAEGRTAMLRLLNNNEGTMILMHGAMKPWVYGRDAERISVQVSINHAELLDD